MTEPTFQAFNIEIEQALLGAIIVKPSELSNAQMILPDGADFSDPAHALLYETIVQFGTMGRSLNPLTLQHELSAEPGFRELGPDYITNLAFAAPALANVKDLACIIRDLALKREALQALDNARATITRTSLSLSTALSGVADVASRVSVINARRAPVTADDIGSRIVETAERSLTGIKPPSVPTGHWKIDEKIGGERAGDLILIAGASGMAKTTLMASWALRAAMAGKPVLIFSFDMSAEQWWERSLCDVDFDLKDAQEQSIWYQRVRNGTLRPHEVGRLELARQRVRGIPLEIIDERGLSITDICARSENFRARYPDQLGKIVVDYAQKVIGNAPKGATREREVASVAEGLKNLAERLGWPREAGAQVSKGVDARKDEDKRPVLSDLRESAVLGNEADLVIAPWRKAYYIRQRRPEADAGPLEVDAYNGLMAQWEHRLEALCLKNRHGEPFNDVTLYCEIAAAVIRDEKPTVGFLSTADTQALALGV